MEFRVLGPIEVVQGERLVDIGPRMHRAVLAVLLINANRVVSVDHLVDRLWGEEPPTTAVSALQGYVSHLRRVLEPDRPPRSPPQVLVTRPPGYVVRIDVDALDAARFEALIAQGRDQLRAGQPEAARAALQPALALWRGQPYADLAFEEFVQAEGARLDELRAGAAEALAEAELALGRHAAAVTELERLAEAEPLRERRWELLALALYRCGRQAEALRALAEARRILGEELGIDAGAPLRQLESDILRQSPSLDWQAPAAEVTAAPASPPTAAAESLLVGREQEVSQLLDVLQRGLGGTGGVALLTGEPGIGKTRLAEELAARAAAEGAQVAWGRCHEGEGTPAFWPWMQVVRTLADALSPDDLKAALGAAAAEIAQVVPEIKELVSDLPPVAAVDAAAARTRLYDALSRFLLRTADRRPLVVVLDDLHWADPPSAEVFGFLACQLRAARVVAVGTYRDGEVGDSHPLNAVLAALAREPNVARIPVGGLGAADVARLLGASSDAESSPELVETVWDRTEGNPFFVAEFVRLLETEGGVAGEVPGRVRDVIRRRLALLPEASAGLLNVASVMGRDFDLEVVARVADRDLDEALELAEAGLAGRILVEVPDAVGSYRFSHALVRETLYGGMSALRRARLHQRVAETLETRPGTDPLELAHHYWQAAAVLGGAFAALDWAERAAEQALSRLAYEQTEELLDRALKLLERLPAGPERDRRELEIQGRRWHLLAMTRGKAAPEVGEVATRAAELGRKLGDARHLAPTLYRLASFHALRGQVNVSLGFARELLALAETTGDRVIRFLGHTAYGYADLYLGRLPEARQHLDEARGLPDVLHDQSLIPVVGQHPAVGCWGYLAMVVTLMGDADEAGELVDDALALAERLGHPFTRAMALHYRAWEATTYGRRPDVRRRAEEAVAACREGGFRMWEAAATILLGWVQAHEGEPNESAALMARSLAAFEATGVRRYQHSFLALLGEVHLLASGPHEALRVLDKGLREVSETGERFYEAELHRLKGEALVRLPGRAPEAEASFQRALDVASAQGARLLEERAAASRQALLLTHGEVAAKGAGRE